MKSFDFSNFWGCNSHLNQKKLTINFNKMISDQFLPEQRKQKQRKMKIK